MKDKSEKTDIREGKVKGSGEGRRLMNETRCPPDILYAAF